MAGKPQAHPEYVHPRTVPVNDRYFDSIDTPEKAYLFGLFCADGYITTRGATIGIDLLPEDAYLLERMAELLEYQGEVKHYQLARLVFTSWPMRATLEGYGITPNKSFELPGMADVVPPELASHFVRGFFDGNGSWAYTLRGTKGMPSYRRRLTWNLRSTPDMCAYIQSVLPVPSTYHHTKTGVIQVTRAEHVPPLGEWLYQDAELRLERKYERWRNCAPGQ